MAKLLVPDNKWAEIVSLLPSERPKPKGGKLSIPNSAALAGIPFVLRTELLRHFPLVEMGYTLDTSYWCRLHEWHKVAFCLGSTWPATKVVQWDEHRAAMDSVSVFARKGARTPA